MEKVSAVRCDHYFEEAVYWSVKEAIEKIGFELPSNERVLIKPNLMAQNTPEQHTITHYTVIDAVCRLLSEQNNTIIIGDSMAFYQKGLTAKAFETSRITEVAKKYGATLISFEETELVKISGEAYDLQGLDELVIPKILLEVDLVIDLCKLKSHGSMRLSGAVKNMYGCLPGGYKQKIHMWVNSEYELSDVFIDIHNVVKPELSIMDAIVSLDGGPAANGKPVKTAMIFASQNPAALDAVAARMIGYEVDEIPILIQAQLRGMIEEYDDIQVIGDVEPVTFKHLVKESIDRPYDNHSIMVSHTYVDMGIATGSCNQCERCMNACPVNAISNKNGIIKLDTNKCINCYYCMTVCPNDAIKIKPTVINRLGRTFRKITGW